MFPEGYFYLICKKTGYGLHIDGDDDAGDELEIGPMKEGHDDYLWSYENGVLISKQTSLAADIKGGDLKIGQKLVQFHRKKTMTHSQRFGFRNGYIYPLADPRLVIAAKNDGTQSDAIVVARNLEGDELQQWSIQPATE